MNQNVKKWIAVAAAAVMMLSLLVGCGGKKQETGVTNPLTEVSAEELLQATGLELHAPDGATDVKFFTLQSENSLTAQMVFTFDGVEYTYRAQSTGELETYDMSGLYYDDWKTEEVQVSYCSAVAQSNDKAAAVYWLDVVPGVNYTLSCTDPTTVEQLVAMANQIFEPTQGDADGDVSTGVEGYFEDGNFNTVYLTNAGMNVYDIEIGIYRLTTFNGEARLSNDGVDFVVEDPNGGQVTGTFYPADDGTYTLTFTESNWSLLESGTTFEGFAPPVITGEGLDYTGHYLNGQDDSVCSSVRMTQTEPGTYDVQIDIYRLASFEGQGNIMDGAVEFTVKDPNGNDMCGIFYPTEYEDVYNLTFTESTWSLLESGTTIENFVPVVD